MKRYFFLILFFVSSVFIWGQEYERNIMIEVFTNSHCPLCPAAHNTINSYLTNSPNSSRVRYMYYHMSYPYPDDELYQDNTSDPDGRNQIYGPFSSTPRAFFDGENQSNSYNQWSSRIDSRLAIMSPVNLNLTGSADGLDVNITANIDMSSSLSGNLVIHFIVVEDVVYNGRNGITNHTNVVRDMVTSPSGEPISISANQEFTKSFSLSNEFNASNVSVIVFIQDASTLEVYQAAEISYAELGSTDVNDETINYEFRLEQNYPNPFNPTTIIKYALETQHAVSLRVYNILGKEVATLVNETKPAGNYKLQFDASNLPSGIYFYTLNAGEFTSTKKLTLIK